MTITDLRLKGEPGIWLSAPLGACVLRDLEQLELTRDHARLLDESLTLSETESRVLRKANRSLRLSLSSTQDALILQTEQTIAEQKKTKKAKRRGKLAVVGGVLAGAGAGIVAGVMISR